MKKTLLLLTLSLLFNACHQKETKLPTNPEKDNKLIGTWKMIYGEIRENDSLEIKDVTKTEFVKMINKTHFAFFNQPNDSVNGAYAGGGTYTLVGKTYTETLNYTGVEAIRGHSFPFTIEIKGDTLIQYGLEEVKEANIKRDIVEKYIRISE